MWKILNGCNKPIFSLVELGIHDGAGNSTVHTSTSKTATIRKNFELIFVVLSLITVIPALAGCNLNIVKLGFDQLYDKPSQSLGKFVHWFTWIQSLDVTLLHIVYALIQYTEGVESIRKITDGLFSLSPTIFLFSQFC